MFLLLRKEFAVKGLEGWERKYTDFRTLEYTDGKLIFVLCYREQTQTVKVAWAKVKNAQWGNAIVIGEAMEGATQKRIEEVLDKNKYPVLKSSLLAMDLASRFKADTTALKAKYLSAARRAAREKTRGYPAYSDPRKRREQAILAEWKRRNDGN